jgi:HD-GYP domain-containing protein (c-di-GMP phosphodiesterase class II)
VSEHTRIGDDTQGTRRMTINDLGLTAVGREGAAAGPSAFLHAWFQLVKNAQFHAIDNAALRRPIQRLAELTAQIVAQDGRISFQAKDGALFVNGAKLKLSTEEYGLADDLFAFFAERGMTGFVIEAPLRDADVRKLLAVLVYAAPAERAFEAIERALRDHGLPVRVNRLLSAQAEAAPPDPVLDKRAYTFLTYSKAVVLYRTLLSEDKMDPVRRHQLMRKITRVVQALVDVCQKDDHTLLGIVSVKSGDEYAPHHSVNTALLAVALGDKVGLGKVELCDLGLAALFHDFGMRRVPSWIREKTAPLDASERAIVGRHLLETVEFLLGERMLTRSALSRIAVAFEHYRRITTKGVDQGATDLYSRIVKIANVYDALTTDRPWRKAYLPDEALSVMMFKMTDQLDPLLLKVFVNTLGLYPVGTLVRLSTGEMGLVVFGGGEGERVTRPIVALLTANGRTQGTVDLTEKDASGAYRREIAFSEDPTRYGLQPSGLLMEAATA